MPIKDEATLEQFRHGPCAWCGRGGRTEPNHVTSRGFGGGLRFDVPFNLIALCHSCHRLHHDGKISREQIVALVAAREGLTPEQWWEELYRMRREDHR